MAPPPPPEQPPSQAGKFKPRKQAAKKIVVGNTVSSSGQPLAVRPGGRGGGGRGRGRSGGRTPGGGGRVPLPRGQVFFTGTPAAAKSKTASVPSGAGATGGGKGGIKTAASSASTSRKDVVSGSVKMAPHNKDTESEIIVGELDVGVGAHFDNFGKPLSVLERDDDDDRQYNNNASMADYTQQFVSIAETYDSDSSLEQDGARQRHSTVLNPTQLPFPIPPMPIGVGGGSSRPSLYLCQDSIKDEDNATYATTAANTSSPFCDATLKKDQDSWFLFQFPTRLPMIVPEAAVSLSEPLAPTQIPAPAPAAAMLLNAAFDNSMKHGGKLGTLKIYKSGKTVLDMGNGLFMNVAEGLPNGFYQQATVIDPTEGNFVVLGQVQKTVVVTPKVKEAF